MQGVVKRIKQRRSELTAELSEEHGVEEASIMALRLALKEFRPELSFAPLRRSFERELSIMEEKRNRKLRDLIGRIEKRHVEVAEELVKEMDDLDAINYFCVSEVFEEFKVELGAYPDHKAMYENDVAYFKEKYHGTA